MYENATRDWEYSQGERGFPRLHPLIDEALADINLAPILNVPAHMVRSVDPIHLHAAMVRLRAERLDQEQKQRK